MTVQTDIDTNNSAFWDYLCGSWLAKEVGITGREASDLARYDAAYLNYYPFLLRRVPIHEFVGKRVLEVGLGFGTLGQKIAENCAEYTGLDIARGPVEMLQTRLALIGKNNSRAITGSILNAPFDDASFDVAVSIGCLHHTGDLHGSISELHRLLKPGGRAYVMVYNQFGYANWRRFPSETFAAWLGRPDKLTAAQRRAYDQNAEGDAAPETVFTSRRDLRTMFSRYASYQDHLENWAVGRRELVLNNLARITGCDIYVEAVK